MSDATPRPDTATADRETREPPKKLEILKGARRVFRAEGFAGASMGQIAQAAGVSKGTLYVYFDSKEDLFRELVVADKRETAERLSHLEEDGIEVDRALQRFGESFVAMLTAPEHIALIRMVIGAADKLPDAGRAFYEVGPAYGIKRLAAYLERQAEAGKLAIDEDMERAAAQFLNLCQGDLAKSRLFCCGEQPGTEEIKATVASAVRLFMRAYQPRNTRAEG